MVLTNNIGDLYLLFYRLEREYMVDKEVVIDDNLITSRKLDDIPAFSAAIIQLFSQKTSSILR